MALAGRVPSMSSVAEAEPKLTATPAELGASAVTFAGGVTTGGVVSAT